MNHSFAPSKLNIVVCATCARNMLAHTALAKCESCNNTGKCDIVNDILMCEECFSRELELDSNDTLAEQLDSSASAEDNTNLDSILPSEPTTITSTHLEKLAKSMLVDLPANGSEFYNAKVLAIVKLEQKIVNDENIPQESKRYFLAEQLQLRQQLLYKALVQTKELITEIDAERHANYRAINLLAQNLKAEEREKLNIKYAEYKPQTVPKRITRPRMTAEDKVIEGMAKTMFAPKNDKGQVSWEELEASEREKLIQQAKQYYNMLFKKKG